MQRQLLSTLALLLVAALLGGVGGYVYTHDPQREVLTIAVDSAPSAAGDETHLSGAVVEAGGGTLRLENASSRIDLTLPAGVRIEELRALPATGLTPGTYVNVGVERSNSSTAISGIVALEAAR